MENSVPTGAAGSGFVNGTAGMVLLIALLVAVVSVGPVREMLIAHTKRVVRYFIGPSAEEAESTAAAAAPEEEPTSATGRASERVSYDFDLSLLAIGDRAEESPNT